MHRDEFSLIENLLCLSIVAILILLVVGAVQENHRDHGLVARCADRPPFTVKNWHYSPDDGWRFVTPEGRIIQSTYACEVSDDYVNPTVLSKP